MQHIGLNIGETTRLRTHAAILQEWLENAEAAQRGREGQLINAVELRIANAIKTSEEKLLVQVEYAGDAEEVDWKACMSEARKY